MWRCSRSSSILFFWNTVFGMTTTQHYFIVVTVSWTYFSVPKVSVIFSSFSWVSIFAIRSPDEKVYATPLSALTPYMADLHRSTSAIVDSHRWVGTGRTFGTSLVWVYIIRSFTDLFGICWYSPVKVDILRFRSFTVTTPLFKRFSILTLKHLNQNNG